MTKQEFNSRQEALLEALPREFHGAISYYAWREGHSSGYEEVLIYVGDLVSILEKPISDYTSRVKGELK